MKRTILLLWWAWPLAAFLLGCGGDTGPAQAAVPTTGAPTGQPVVATPPFVPPASTSLPAGPPATATAEPTATPSPTPTPTATPTPTPRPQFSRVELALVAQGLEAPVYLTHAGDDRLFILEQTGQIRIWANGQLLPTPFLALDVACCEEMGLLGLAFHPQYATNGYFYVNYTFYQSGRLHTAVSRFSVSADPNQAERGSELRLLTFEQPFVNHNGGGLIFGPDGYLYVGVGDGGSQYDPAGYGQKLSTWLGKILRLDVDAAEPYAIPADNPFVNVADARPEIWAYGLRNPWRLSFDRATGELFIGDVGQDLIEEIDYVPAGAPGGLNFGWAITEGSQCLNSASCDVAGLTFPVTEYTHPEGGCSVTGGYVYRGQQFPALRGLYFLSDYCTGFIWALWRDADDRWQRQLAHESWMLVSSFGEDAQGEIYVVVHAGAIYQLRPAGP